MKRKKIIKDERVIKESNAIYKYCFHFLCLFLFFDIVYKFYYHNALNAFNKGNWINYVLELGIVVILLYIVLFAHAYKGILVYAIDLPNNKFQFKRSIIVSSFVSGFVSVVSFIIPVIVKEIFYGIAEMPFGQAFMIYLLIALACFIILFILSIINFFLAYLLSRYRNNIKKYN